MASVVAAAEGSTEAADAEESIGAVVRRLRREKGMSLQNVANASGVSIGMLSQVERDLVNPSVRVLTGIRRALNVPFESLFQGGELQRSDPGFVRRVGFRPILELGELRKELLSANGAHNLQLMILHIEPGGTSGATLLAYPAEKGGMVLSGEVVLTVGEEQATLREGDSFLFDSSLPHGFRNETDKPAQVLWIIGAVQLDRHL
ncbi:cupin domain-containing protein [Aureimonas populi]|uniref:Cupin domain-containing protein n=1 Tax=Aureimonas populi TaxID=1701758 RepID=A0ABW5CLL6_9HYPH|nr:cupin domain-containing protein [Aureimonas populi]